MEVSEKEVILNGQERHAFHFDAVFPEFCSQIDVYEDAAQPILDNCLKASFFLVQIVRIPPQGFNGAILGYGQTG